MSASRVGLACQGIAELAEIYGRSPGVQDQIFQFLLSYLISIPILKRHTLHESGIMSSLLDLLCAYPILENLAAVLPLGDLFNLSKTNSVFRAVLHGFPITSVTEPSYLTNLRPSLSVGRHNTPHWKNLKAKSPLCCSEPQHTRGVNIKGCLMCSMPVCEACIIKASFGKRDENTFPNRTRSLCVECFDSGNPHQEVSLTDEKTIILSPYLTRTECVCTAKDGHLCLGCKTKQNSSLGTGTNQCYGMGCLKSTADGFGGRVCLWCGLSLPRERSRAESRRDYDARHLLARTHSSYDQSSGAEAEDSFIDPAEQGAVWASFRSERTTPPKKAKAVAYDRFEDERRRELEEVSERRRITASALEEERWRRSEALRRSGPMCRASPPTRVQGPNYSFIRSDSPASTLAPEDGSSLPKL